MHSFQTTDTQTMRLVRGQTLKTTPRVEKHTWGWGGGGVVKGLSCLLHFRCVWSQSVTNTASIMHVIKGSIWSPQQRGAPSHSTRILQRNTAKDHWCALLTNKRLTLAVTLNIAPLYFCQRVPLTFTRNSCLRAPERTMWGGRLPKIGCLFIFKASDFACFI